MSDIALLLHAIAALLWPILAFFTLFIFRRQIAELARRLKKGKLLGQEIELNDSLDRLEISATSVEQTVAALPEVRPGQQTVQDRVAVTEDATVRNILSEAAKSPKAALLLLTNELEKLARELLASIGKLQDRRIIPVQTAIAELDQHFGLPRLVSSSLKFFWDARNRLIHGGEGSDEDALRVVDSGLMILKALKAVPREINLVYESDITVFTDSALATPMTDAMGVILESVAPGGVSRMLRIFPTTRTHFRKGQQVAWEWNMQAVFGPAWYRDPITGDPTMAWSSSAEFIGRHLSDL